MPLGSTWMCYLFFFPEVGRYRKVELHGRLYLGREGCVAVCFRDVHILRCVRITASKYYIYTAIKVL